MAWNRIKHSIILEDPFDDPAGLADLIPDKSPELKPPAEVWIWTCCSQNVLRRNGVVHLFSYWM